MTRDEILSMQPGRELDAEVARQLFGWEHVADYGPNAFDERVDMWFGVPPGRCFAMLGDEVHLPTICENRLPHYSTSIADAWLVVEALKSMGNVVIIKVDGLGVEDGKLYRDLLPPYVVYVGDCEGIRYKEAPHAVCIAALLALDGEHEEL